MTEIAKQYGVLLPHNDPILMIGTMLEPIEARIESLAKRMDETKAGAQFTPAQVDTLGRHLAAGCAAWAPRIARTIDRRTAAAVVGLMLASGFVGVAIGRWAHPSADISGLTCTDQPDHSRACWVIVTPAPKR